MSVQTGVGTFRLELGDPDAPGGADLADSDCPELPIAELGTPDCVSGGPVCGEGTLCSWNGDGHCCRKPFQGKRCIGDQDCVPGEVCGLATSEDSPTGETYACIRRDDQCLDKTPAVP